MPMTCTTCWSPTKDVRCCPPRGSEYAGAQLLPPTAGESLAG
jgi:hypothetical protein